MRVASSAPAGALFWRLLVIAEEQSRLTFIEEYVSGAPDPGWNNDQLHSLHRVKGSDFRVVNTSKLRP